MLRHSMTVVRDGCRACTGGTSLECRIYWSRVWDLWSPEPCSMKNVAEAVSGLYSERNEESFMAKA